ncbi:complex I NDUFA9 subunit family protein [Haloquadratum walsbyi]|jgi:Predicted nucleoside-diphosphate-sugar epimerases|uniref:Putative nucleoside-diphosphate-sugar epimerase n=1 Tax=Haloquadratum walsbyi J07HQW2 TaxID=1238425 RepID=U1NF83_9EURY|nr:complex I NDUFA9 subunit family protein [Haloquadratum walsbyi]ERG95438.1 MAG: putative nucleoside-diphosphate-sugar epimerase [Haloquadratum walsbyi J07HQW2]
MDVLVIGGSGFIGVRLCTELSNRDHEVIAVSRSPDDSELPGDVDTEMGDVTAYDSLSGLFDDIDVVYNLVALSPLFKPSGGDEMHDIVHRQGTENIVRAAEANNVSQLVQLSALGADPDGTTAYVRAKGRAETAVTESDSDLDSTIFRPSVVFGDGGEFISFTKLLAPPYVSALPGGGKTRFQPIWVDDLVPMLADAVETDTHHGEIYEIGGPERLTLAEIAQMIHTADGRSTTILPVPMSLAKIGLTVGDLIPGFPMGVDQYRSLQFDNVTDKNNIDAFARTVDDLTTLEAYLSGETDYEADTRVPA